MANIYDVAKEAGVSIATVSAVINESSWVSPRTKKRVEAAVRKLGYQPNLLARSLAKKQSHMIATIVPDISNPFFPDVIRGAEDMAHEHNYSLVVASSDNDPRRERLYLDLFLAKQVDGILLTKAPGKLSEELRARASAFQPPMVQLMRSINGFKSDTVMADDWGAAYESVTHLLRLGYRRIGLITGAKGVSTTRRRLAGYRQALKDWGIEFEPRLVAGGDYRVQSGYLAGLDLLKQDPEAVFVSNYLMTVGLMRALDQYQLRCPRDVGIVTCDDYAWLDSFSPRLTTIDFPKYRLGSEAARLLIERLNHPDRPLQTLKLKNSLNIRESCGYLPRWKEQPAAARSNPGVG
ncbi:MAG: LacI family DNA-binding transcriptional regulator [Acidobacteriota bacterium]